MKILEDLTKKMAGLFSKVSSIKKAVLEKLWKENRLHSGTSIN